MKISECSLFEAILPDQQETRFLQACLANATQAAEAWNRWLESTPNFSSEFKNKHSLKALAPVLHVALSAKEIEAPAEMKTFLRTAYLQEQLRAQTFRACAKQVLRILQQAGIPFLVVKGAVLAEHYYPDAGIRHCHDLDLFLDAKESDAAFATLRTHVDSADKRNDGTISFKHASGFVVSIHTRLFSIPHYSPPVAEIWQRAENTSIAEVEVRVPAQSDMLLHVLGHAVSCSRRNLMWVSDSVMILQRREFDWQEFVSTAIASNLSLPAFVLLSYLGREMQVDIRPSILQTLRNGREANSLAAAESLLIGIRLQSRKTFRLFRFTNSWLERLLLLKCVLLPHPMSTKWIYRVRHKSLLPFYYLYRPVRYLFWKVSAKH